MTAKGLKDLRKAHESFMKRWKAGGKPVVVFQCPICDATTERTRPSSRGETWDSLGTCPYCGGTYFFAVKSRGPIQIEAVNV